MDMLVFIIQCIKNNLIYEQNFEIRSPNMGWLKKVNNKKNIASVLNLSMCSQIKHC